MSKASISVEQFATLQLQAAAMSAASNAMFITDADGKVLWVNDAFVRITGYAADEVIGRRPNILKSGRQSESWYREFWTTIKSGRTWRGRNINRRKNGELFDVEQTVTPILGSDGRIANFISVHEDISERVRSEQQIHRLALYDAVTGLPNRSAFGQSISEALARVRRSGRSLAVMLLDLDYFKNVNDSLGHAAGDELLRQVGQRMRQRLRDSDLAARLGGDEFALLFEDLDGAPQALQAATRLLQDVSAPYEIFGHAAHIGASIGIAMYPGDTGSPETLLERADRAMYEAKRRGRGRCQFFDAAMDATAHQRHNIGTALEAAILGNLLRLEYQPLYRLADQRMSGIEALLRWRDAERGDVAPGEFVPLAEQCGLMAGLNEWALRQALRQAGQWKRRYGATVPVAVNVSTGLFEKGGLAMLIETLLLEHGLCGSDIDLEVSGGLTLSTSTVAQQTMVQLERLGVKLVVHDFGAVACSMLSLLERPLSHLKIDASLVRGIGLSDKEEKMIGALVALARKLELRVVAEGVETAEQESFLRGEACSEAQGFRYARPAPPEAIEALLEKHTLATPKPLSS